MRRREVLLGIGAAVVAASSPSAQPGTAQVGVLFPGGAAAMNDRMSPFRQGVFSTAGRNDTPVEIVGRAAEGNPEQLPALAAGLVTSGGRATLAVSPPAVRAVRNATRTIPIVAHDLETDPVANG